MFFLSKCASRKKVPNVFFTNAMHFSGVSILGEFCSLKEIKPCQILPLFSLSRAFISATSDLLSMPLSLNTPVFFCRYSYTVKLPAARFPSVVM